MTQLSRGNRTGRNFCIRISEAEMQAIRAAGFGNAGPGRLGPWLLWRALARAGIATAGGGNAGSSDLLGNAWPATLFDIVDDVQALPSRGPAPALPELAPGIAGAGRRILDLCSGSGSWSRPYEEAGYQVDRVTLPEGDVTTFEPPHEYDGVLAAPPCQEFSIAKTTGPGRDLALGLVCVVHCMRVIALARPRWWALENPGSGLLRRFLGKPRMTFQPHDFGDQHTKLTALWGNFALPSKTPVKPTSRMIGSNSHARAITPRGFAAAFFAANQ